MPNSRVPSPGACVAIASLAASALLAGCSASAASSASVAPWLDAGGATGATGPAGTGGATGATGATGGAGDDASVVEPPADSGARDAASLVDDGGTVERHPDAAPFDADVPDALPASYLGTPFGGAAQTIPGTITLARYDLGGEGVAYHDTGSAAAPYAKCGLTRSDGVNLDCTDTRDLAFPACGPEPAGEVYLAYIGSGEWFNYTVVVAEAGTFVLSGHIATASATTKVSLAFSPAVGTGAITLPSDVGCSGHEAYHNWSDASALAEIALTPGRYVMTLTIVSQGLNLDSFTFTKK